MAYIYAADVWCNSCGKAICDRIKAEGHAPADPDDECSYDSDEYPKHASDDDEADTPQHCAAMDDCLEAEVLEDGSKVGKLFGSLTSDGEAYVLETHKDRPTEVTKMWLEFFDISVPDEDTDDFEEE